MGILEIILTAVLPEVLKGIASLIENYEAGKIDEAALAKQVREAFTRGGETAATLVANFSDAHMQAFIEKLKADAKR